MNLFHTHLSFCVFFYSIEHGAHMPSHSCMNLCSIPSTSSAPRSITNRALHIPPWCLFRDTEQLSLRYCRDFLTEPLPTSAQQRSWSALHIPVSPCTELVKSFLCVASLQWVRTIAFIDMQLASILLLRKHVVSAAEAPH